MKKLLLLIEDNQKLLQAYQKKLSKSFDLIVAINGQSGLDSAIKQQPNLIILDIILPGKMNGFDVLRELKQNSTTKDIPVIVLTNLEDEEENVKQEGASSCLVKSNTSLKTIIKEINKHL